MKSYRILVVEDDALNLQATQCLLEESGYLVDAVSNPEAALKLTQSPKHEYAVMLLDYHLPRKNGAELAREILQLIPDQLILIYSGDSSRDALKSTFRAGAVDFIEKGNGTERFLETIQIFCTKYDETRRTISSPESKDSISYHGMIGRSSTQKDLARKIELYSQSSENILILGETGTGKELVARALAKDKPFLVVNCAAFKGSVSLLESELFGYERGAFTGAAQSRIGLLEAAKGGAVFFDELHQLGLDAQAKLLRVFQEKKIRRVGGKTEYPVDFRIIAAAKNDLEKLMENGDFLSDLYFRLNALRIEVPPLRTRIEDIEPLVAYFCEAYSKQNGTKKTFLHKTIQLLERYSWPGNVRELKNTVTQLLIDSAGKIVEPKDLEAKFFQRAKNCSSGEDYLYFKARQEQEEVEFISTILSSSKNKLEAARRMKLSPNTLHSKMLKHGMYCRETREASEAGQR